MFFVFRVYFGRINILTGPLSQVLRLESNNIPGPVVGGPLECNFEEKTIVLVDFLHSKFNQTASLESSAHPQHHGG